MKQTQFEAFQFNYNQDSEIRFKLAIQMKQTQFEGFQFYPYARDQTNYS